MTCVISDIVKRRSIRVGSCSKQLLREPSLSPDHFGARASSKAAHKAALRDKRVVNDPLAKLDRLAIGTILRSKLVFLVNVRLQIAFIEGACRKAILQTTFCRVCGH